MKKFIALALSIVTIVFASTTVQAEEVFNNGTAESTITYKADSEFCVLIPETIDLKSKNCDFSVSYMDIMDNEYIDIRLVSPDVTLTSESGKTLQGTINNENDGQIFANQSIVTFSNADDNAMTKTFAFNFSHTGVTGAGNYTGTITFDISLQTQ